jgi:hypothetical protein
VIIPSRHKIALGIVVSALVVVLGSVLWILWTAARKFERMERHVKALHEEIRQRDMSRPPRPGTPVPGNAWEDYDQALAAVTADKTGLREVDLFVQRDPKAETEAAQLRVAAHVATYDLLKSGVRREKSDLALHWELGNDLQFPGLLTCSKLGYLVAARARFLARDGKNHEAVELLLDGCQFGRDLSSNSSLLCQVTGQAVCSNLYGELRDLIVSGSLSKEDLLEMDRGLEAADRSYPKFGQTLMNESLYLGYLLLNSKGSPELGDLLGYGVSLPGYWRYGFSPRLTFASAFEEAHSIMKRASAVDELPWPEARKILTDSEQEGRSSKNPIVRMVVPGFLSSARALRDRRTQLRLLRTAAIWRATGACPELDDPFGTILLHSEKDGVLRAWSVGRDGIDRGGVGGWKPDAGKNTVLEWKR